MKNYLQSHPVFFKMALLATCFMLVIVYNHAKASAYEASAAQDMAVHHSK